MSTLSKVSRREFLETTAAAGAGLVIGFHLPAGGRVATPPAAPFAPNAWLRISPDNSVLIVVDRSEMGQGVATALPMLVAEELDADWTKVKIESAPADKSYVNPLFGFQGTGGSTSVRAAYTPLRKAGAAAREMLVAAACQTWGVDRVDCRTERGAVIHTGSKRQLTYGQLAAKAASLPVPENPTLKEPKAWKILGRRVKRLDTPAKVDGSAQFGIDTKVPGMLVAVVARCPAIGGKVASFDATKTKAVPGVKDAVQISSGVAVVADGYWNAKKGRDALDVPRRRLRPALRAGLHPGSTRDVEGGRGSRESRVVARGRHSARPVSPRLVSRVPCRTRCERQAGGLDPPHRRAVDHGARVPPDHQERDRRRSGRGRRGHALRDRQCARGLPHARHRHPRGLLALREQHLQRVRGRELHRRAGARRQAGPLRVPTRPARQGAAPPRRPESRREQSRLEHAASGRALPRHRGLEVVRDLRGRGRRDLDAAGRHAASSPRGVRGGLRAGGESQHRRGPDGKCDRVRAHGGAVG